MRPELAMQLMLEEAKKPGPSLSPDAVITVLTAITDPVMAISVIDKPESLQVACDTDFSFLALLRNPTQINATAIAKAAELIRWLANEAKTWADSSDPQRQRLAAMLLTSACCDIDGSLWANLPTIEPPSHELLATLSKIVSGAKFSIDSHGEYDSAPIWEREAVEKLKQANDNNDWQALDRLWLAFRSAVRPNLVLTEAMRCLASFDSAMLTGALSSVSHIVLAMQLTAALSQAARLRLGAASDNSFIQFSVLSYLAQRGNTSPISEGDQEVLILLLEKVALDIERWRTWVGIFGTRHEVQEALGHVLAETSDAAVESYINALPLSTIPTNTRAEVAICLRAFRSTAKPHRAKLLWTLAFERWKTWDFPNEIKDLPLTRVTESILDYAVVGYLVECVTKDDRERIYFALIAELGQLDRPWYVDMTQYLDVVHRVMSRLQPYLQAERVSKTGADWLQLQTQWPFDFTRERYRAMTLSANFG